MPAISFIPGPGDSADANNPLRQVGMLAQVLGQVKELSTQNQRTQLEIQHQQLLNQGLEQQNANFQDMAPIQKAMAFAQARSITAQASQQEVETAYAPSMFEQKSRIGEQQLQTGEQQIKGNALQQTLEELTLDPKVRMANMQASGMKLKLLDDENDRDVQKKLREEAPFAAKFTLQQYGIDDPKAAAHLAPFMTQKVLEGALGAVEQSKQFQAHQAYLNANLANEVEGTKLRTEAMKVQGYRDASHDPGLAAGMLAINPDDPVLQTVVKYNDEYRKFDPMTAILRAANDPNATDDEKAKRIAAGMQLMGRTVPQKKGFGDDWKPLSGPDYDSLKALIPDLKKASKVMDKAVQQTKATTQPAISKDAPGSTISDPTPITSPAELAKLPTGSYYTRPGETKVRQKN